jgi:DNA-directed RNA polymerase subunit RPC12/RpoP
MTTTTKTGRLEKLEHVVGRLDHPHYECVDCGTRYPLIREYDEEWNETMAIKCNGHVITVCPWCRPDNEPWEHGRGV